MKPCELYEKDKCELVDMVIEQKKTINKLESKCMSLQKRMEHAYKKAQEARE